MPHSSLYAGFQLEHASDHDIEALEHCTVPGPEQSDGRLPARVSSPVFVRARPGLTLSTGRDIEWLWYAKGSETYGLSDDVKELKERGLWRGTASTATAGLSERRYSEFIRSKSKPPPTLDALSDR